MNELIESIINKEYTKADNLFNEALNAIVVRKLNEAKKMYTAKMFSEQVTVNNMGRVPTSVGTEPRSYYVQRKGLAEGDVVPLGSLEKSGNKNTGPKVHVGNTFVAVDHGDKVTFHKNEDNKPGKMLGSLGSEGRKTFQQAHSNSLEEVGFTPDASAGTITKERALDTAVRETMTKHKPDLEATSSVTKLKEEAKKAALKLVSKRKETPEEKRERFLSALEGPGSSSNQKPSMKVVKEQVPSEQDSAKVGQMAQQASDSGKIENIINRDKDSRAVGELANQKVEPRQTVQTGQKSLSNPSERPGVVPRTTLNHPKFRPVR